MKLYATVTSERASKGQGGNKRLDVQFTAGAAQESVGVVSLREREPDVFVLVYTHNGEQKNIATIETKGECKHGQAQASCATCKWIEATKGEKQKGERICEGMIKGETCGKIATQGDFCQSCADNIPF